MLKSLFMAAFALVATPVVAQTAPVAAGVVTTATMIAVKHNDTIVTADGKRLGQVDMIRQGRAMILRDGAYVSVPVTSLSPDGSRYKTSLNLKQISGS